MCIVYNTFPNLIGLRRNIEDVVESVSLLFSLEFRDLFWNYIKTCKIFKKT